MEQRAAGSFLVVVIERGHLQLAISLAGWT
jgi:hypothetical protein